MLAELRIENLGVIEDAVLPLAPGFNVVTGETGAGKTMIVSGLGLLLGSRADAGLVRSGSGSAVVEGLVEVPEGHPAAVRAAEAGGDVQDGLVLVRTVTAEGRSRAHVAGRSAPVGVLGELGEMLVAVHGQADQWRLRRPDQHRVLLDGFGGAPVAAAADEVARLYARWKELDAELERLRALQRDRTVESEVLRHGLDELERVDPQAGEEDELREEEDRLAHADSLRESAGRAHDLLMGGDESPDSSYGSAPAPATQALTEAAQALASGSDHDPGLASLAERARELSYLAADLGADVAAYLASAEGDPARLEWVQQRRAELARVLRSYGPTSGDAIDWSRRAALRLAELDGSDDRISELEEQRPRLIEELAAAAARLSAARVAAAEDFGARVTAELRQLAMGSATVSVAVEPRPDPTGIAVPGVSARSGIDGPVRIGAHGIDEVEIRLAANPGAPGRSVTKAASGGELSRVMLAIEVVGAQTGAAHGQEVPTYVFDEVDAGVGGKAALAIGARLAELARHAQVICVTHLAQVAAYADQHLTVRKATDGQVTASGVSALDEGERVTELARMMTGLEDSASAQEHARDLLTEARAGRASGTSHGPGGSGGAGAPGGMASRAARTDRPAEEVDSKAQPKSTRQAHPKARTRASRKTPATMSATP